MVQVLCYHSNFSWKICQMVQLQGIHPESAVHFVWSGAAASVVMCGHLCGWAAVRESSLHRARAEWLADREKRPLQVLYESERHRPDSQQSAIIEGCKCQRSKKSLFSVKWSGAWWCRFYVIIAIFREKYAKWFEYFFLSASHIVQWGDGGCWNAGQNGGGNGFICSPCCMLLAIRNFGLRIAGTF